MKVPCKKSNREMEYPFLKCKKCGWKPEGQLAEKAKTYARKYEVAHGIEPKDDDTRGSMPRLVKPAQGKDPYDMLEKVGIKPKKKVLKEKSANKQEIVECPNCGKDIIIDSPERLI